MENRNVSHPPLVTVNKYRVESIISEMTCPECQSNEDTELVLSDVDSPVYCHIVCYWCCHAWVPQALKEDYEKWKQDPAKPITLLMDSPRKNPTPTSSGVVAILVSTGARQ